MIEQAPAISTLEAKVYPEDINPALSEFRDDVEKTLTPEQKIERARIKFECALIAEFEKGAQKYGIDKIDTDHFLLGLGDKRVNGIPFTETGVFNTRSKTHGKLDISSRHQLSIAYDLLRNGVDSNKKLIVGKNETMTVSSIVQYFFGRILESKPGERIFYDYEWIALAAMSSAFANNGKLPEMKTRNGKKITLEQVMAFNQTEFDYKYAPEKFSQKELEDFKLYGDEIGSCDSLHAFHALVDYALLKSDSVKLREYIRFVFDKVQNLDQIFADKIAQLPNYYTEFERKRGELEIKVHFVSHLLTPITDIIKYSPNALSQPEKERLKVIVQNLIQDTDQLLNNSVVMNEFGEIKEESSVGELSHVVDVLRNIPPLFQ